jgi:DNA modification methylase
MVIDTIICGDNFSEMEAFPPDSIDLVVTSPPYDDLRAYGEHEWNFKCVATSLRRILKPGGVVVWVVADATENGSETGTSFRQALFFKEIGFRLHDTMIYDKGGAVYPANDKSNRYSSVFEYMFIFSKGAPKTANLICDRKNRWKGSFGIQANRQRNGELVGSKKRVAKEYGYRFNIWRILAGHGNSTDDDVAFGHPAIFPESLARDHILTWSNVGDIVLDPFNGSGTTTKMARETGRRYIGIDINEGYCEIARKRLDQKLLFS